MLHEGETEVHVTWTKNDRQMGAVSQGGDTLSQQENYILDKIFWANHSAYTLMPDKNYYFALFMQYFLGDESGFAKEM